MLYENKKGFEIITASKPFLLILKGELLNLYPLPSTVRI